jgi:hypothetical protein
MALTVCREPFSSFARLSDMRKKEVSKTVSLIEKSELILGAKINDKPSIFRISVAPAIRNRVDQKGPTCVADP